MSATQGIKVDPIGTTVGAIELMTLGASCKPQQFAFLCVRSQTAQEYSHSSHILLYQWIAVNFVICYAGLLHIKPSVVPFLAYFKVSGKLLV